MQSDIKKTYCSSLIYRPENYNGPIAIDIKPSNECKQYHENSYIQTNIEDTTILKKVTP
jgi:hypothetical protein